MHVTDMHRPFFMQHTDPVYRKTINKGKQMGDISKHFSRHEFACKSERCCGASAPVDGRLILALEEFRAQVGEPLYISSGFRCLTHNRLVGSSDTSQHAKGYAADILCVPNMSISTMASIAESIHAFNQGGIGQYPSFLHLDVRLGSPARWKR